MDADFMTKPIQGEKFYNLRNKFMNISCNYVM